MLLIRKRRNGAKSSLPSRLIGSASPGWSAGPGVLAEYAERGWLARHRRLCSVALAILCGFYGIAFALFGQFILPMLLAPLVPFVLLVIWQLPESDSRPGKTIEVLTFGYLIGLLCWPDYLAIAVPGLPWITVIRLFVFPLTIVFLVSLSTSRSMRQEVRETLAAEPLISKMVAALAILFVLSIFLSADPGQTFNKVWVALVNWIMMFFLGSYVFRKPRRVVWLAHLLLGAAIFVCLIGLWEAQRSQLPWVGHIPSFLKVDEKVLTKILAGTARASTGIYRVQSKFTTSLGLGEFLGLALPFILHLVANSRSAAIRAVAVFSLPLIVYIIIKTDSRLAAVGGMMSVMLYVLAWSAMRWHANKKSLLAPALTLAFPFLFVSFLIGTFTIGRLRAIVWGSGAQTASTASRGEMYHAGLPMVLKNPLGHGLGQGAITLGFYNGDTLTIDTYYLAVALEIGIVGFFVFYGLFLITIWRSSEAIIKTLNQELLFLVPITIALINFFIIKSVFSQLENQPLVFVLVGAAVALISRQQNESSLHGESVRLRLRSNMTLKSLRA